MVQQSYAEAQLREKLEKRIELLENVNRELVKDAKRMRKLVRDLSYKRKVRDLSYLLKASSTSRVMG